jgi:predicted ester cyclase
MKQLIYVLSISALLASCQMNNGAKSGANDMSAKNAAGVKSFYDKVMNAHNADALDSMVAANYTERTPDPGEGPGLAGLKKDIQGWFAAFPDQVFTINAITADSNTVVAL